VSGADRAGAQSPWAPGRLVRLPRRDGLWRVGQVLGEGGQGTVYALEPVEAEAPALALKWYRPGSFHPDQRAALLALVQRPAPSASFLWPIDVVDGETDGEFGYVMPLRPPGFVSVGELLTGRVDVGFGIVVRLAMALADSFLQLHAQGLCYRDISIGNVFFDPATGRPLICDNDNVGVDGESEARVLGTARFMAPEIVRGEAHPSTATDLYSLAVLIFYVLLVHHPLMGRAELAHPCLDAAADEALFGTAPRFIFDPEDDSNAPDPVEHASVLTYWALYPAFVRAEFTRAFTAGLHNPAARVREGIWRSRMARLLDGIVVCACGRENVSDAGRGDNCWSCGRSVRAGLMLRTAGSSLALNAGTRVVAHHLRRDYDYDTVVGVVVAHPRRPGVWGLKNLTGGNWQVTLDDGRTALVEPGRSAGLVPGMSIEFAGARGTLVVPGA
jgi:DNA-binding helix-hairpin-helix protein with protein kinase domain